MLVNKLGVNVSLPMLCRLRFCKSFQSDNYVYYDSCMRTSRHFNCLPKVAKMVCRGSKHDAVFLLSVYPRLT